MKFADLMQHLESIVRLFDQLKPLLDKLPPDTLAKLADAAAKAIDKLGADNLADAARAAIEKAVAKASGGTAGDLSPAPLDKCVHASLWAKDASQRMMNILSPRMPDSVFEERVAWMEQRGCDWVALFLANQGDGEYAGYKGWSSSDAPVMLRRIQALRKRGFGIVPFVVADDSPDTVRELLADPVGKVAAMKTAGLFDLASAVCVGLEMDENDNSSGWKALAKALSDALPGLPLATHHASTSCKYRDLGSIVMIQLHPDKASESSIRSEIAKVKGWGKRPWVFEIARKEARALCQSALANGAEAVGNW